MFDSHNKNLSAVTSAHYCVCSCVDQVSVSECRGTVGLRSSNRCLHPCESETKMLYLSTGWTVGVRQHVFCVLSMYMHARETTTACLCGVWEGESLGLSVTHKQIWINPFPF